MKRFKKAFFVVGIWQKKFQRIKMIKKNIKKSAGKIVAGGLAALLGGVLISSELKAEENNNEIIFTGRGLVNEEFQSQIYGTWNGTDWNSQNRFMVQSGADYTQYGLNLENDKRRLNIGFENRAESESDIGRVLASVKSLHENVDEIGVEYQYFQEAGQNDRIGMFGRFKFDKVRLEATGDSKGNWRAVGFYDTDGHLISVGGGAGKDGNWISHIAYGRELVTDFCGGFHARVGSNDLLDLRARFGSPEKFVQRKPDGFTVRDAGFNDISVVPDYTDPLRGIFDFANQAIPCTGNQKGDIGIDARWLQTAKNEGIAYVAGALNAGNIYAGPVKLGEMIIGADVHKYLNNNTKGSTVESLFKIGNTGVGIRGAATFDESGETNQLIELNYSHAF
jgi:hypothetical protein